MAASKVVAIFGELMVNVVNTMMMLMIIIMMMTMVITIMAVTMTLIRPDICHEYHELYSWKKTVMWRNFSFLYRI